MTAPELTPRPIHTTPMGGCLSFDKFNVPSSPYTVGLMTPRQRVRYLDLLATAAIEGRNLESCKYIQ
ncbi:hypothetical protein TNCV_4112861 [Trichonephila clavipes]|nr:hypothetical protein TNCV_4112861 [Trichonephila clavipes]